MIWILTDSGSDIGQSEYEGIKVVPLKISFDSEEYLDGVDLDHETFYEKLIETNVLPKTSQVGPFDFQEAYEKILSANTEDQIIVITLSAALSGTYQSANIAAENYEGRVFVVDSANVTVGQKCLIMRAKELIDQGKSVEEIIPVLEKEKNEIEVIGLLDTLEYLKKGGRVSGAAAALGSALSIKPVVGVQEGQVAVLGKARGSKNGKNLLNQRVEEVGGVDFNRPFYLGYTGLTDVLIKKYIEDSHLIWENDVTEASMAVLSIGAAIGTHVGPGAIAVGFFHK